MRHKITVLGMIVMFGAAGSAFGEGLRLSGGGKSRSAIFAAQKSLLDGRLSRQYASSSRLRPKGAGVSEDPVTLRAPRYRGRYKGEYLEVAKAMARKHGVPEELFLRLVHQESGWNPGAVSPKGARGLAQLMPQTAATLRVNIHDPHQNLEGGARYLSMMYRKFGSWRLALAAYNAGPKAVEQYDGVPPYAETKNYVKVILGG